MKIYWKNIPLVLLKFTFTGHGKTSMSKDVTHTQIHRIRLMSEWPSWNTQYIYYFFNAWMYSKLQYYIFTNNNSIIFINSTKSFFLII